MDSIISEARERINRENAARAEFEAREKREREIHDTMEFLRNNPDYRSPAEIAEIEKKAAAALVLKQKQELEEFNQNLARLLNGGETPYKPADLIVSPGKPAEHGEQRARKHSAEVNRIKCGKAPKMDLMTLMQVFNPDLMKAAKTDLMTNRKNPEVFRNIVEYVLSHYVYPTENDYKIRHRYNIIFKDCLGCHHCVCLPNYNVPLRHKKVDERGRETSIPHTYDTLLTYSRCEGGRFLPSGKKLPCWYDGDVSATC
jgi:hypothetical protein